MPRRPFQGRAGLFKLTPARPIWRKGPTHSKWLPILVFVFVLIATLALLGHASPPMSRGARPIALGNGYSAVSGDTYALYYNPAGLYEISQNDFTADYGRSYSENEPARTDFNFMYATPYRFREQNYPIAVGLYEENPAPGAHIVDITAGTAMDAPLEQWTKGFLKFPAKVGLAGTLRQQHGNDASPRVAKSALGLGLTGGFIFPINRRLQMGTAIRRLFNPGSSEEGPSISVGAMYRYADYLQMICDYEYASGGISKIKPGLEWFFARGVVRPRLGWGFRDNGGIDSIATGIGFYVSPMQIDITYLIPMKTINDNAGQFRASFSYRFGRPQFTEIYYDRALEQASQLDQNVLIMTTKEAELKASLAELEQKRRIAKEDLEKSKSRIEELKNQDLLGERDAVIRDLKARVHDLEGNLSSERGTLKAIRQKQSAIRTHRVEPGETLQSIAREFYGDPNQWKKIYNANPDKIERGLPKAGATLVIP